MEPPSGYASGSCVEQAIIGCMRSGIKGKMRLDAEGSPLPLSPAFPHGIGGGCRLEQVFLDRCLQSRFNRCPFGNDYPTRSGLSSRSKDLCIIYRKSSSCAEAACSMPHRRTCRLPPRMANETISGWKLDAWQRALSAAPLPQTIPRLTSFGLTAAEKGGILHLRR